MTDAVTALKSLGVTCDLTDLEQQSPTGNKRTANNKPILFAEFAILKSNISQLV